MTTEATSTADKLRRDAAIELWERLKKNLFDVQVALVEIIESRAWEPLGYSTFTEAWGDQMSDIELSKNVQVHVVYQLLAEGRGADQIADAVKGIGPESASVLKRQRDNGVPVEHASHVVREHHRRSPGKHFLTMEIDGDKLAEWKRMAKALDTTVEAIALPAVVAAFEALQ